MGSWEEFVESKTDTSKVDAVEDIASALQRVFKHYTLETRRRAWEKITSKEGLAEVKKLIRTPSRSLSPFRSL